ncbi:hypothetical protein [Bordetella phage vB_BbrM_PHB04]|uniref:Uncharacterized protein n=1 Tax=Bordetella phage vB_BbrM_PHB04 TaxID=2029657 RepID=A0A291LAR4_9CAUD|nr:hypothetical protein HOS14_gp080 [Bordetella phage vB_BbrM_PHB04]ATI15698.1 hypothetical protein [Bordetella phage vB_BbrM_PHB04]
MNAHQRRKARRQDARDYPGLHPYQIRAIKKMRRGTARLPAPYIYFRQGAGKTITFPPGTAIYCQQFGRSLRPEYIPDLIGYVNGRRIEADVAAPTTNQERT